MATKYSKLVIFSVITGIASLISIPLSIYLFFKQEVKPEPRFVFEQTIEIFNVNNVNNVKTFGLNVLYHDTPLEKNLYITKFYFWNCGRKEIEKDNILEPLFIKPADSSITIIDARIVAKTRNFIKPLLFLTIDSLSTSRPCQIPFSFTILEENDGFSGQIVYLSNSPVKFNVGGAIKGVKEIGRGKPIHSRLLSGISKIFWIIASPILILLFIGIIGVGWEGFTTGPLKKWFGEKISKRIAVIPTILFIFIILLIVTILIYGSFRKEFNNDSTVPNILMHANG